MTTTPREALDALHAKMLDQPPTRHSEPVYACQRCQDSGWEELETDGRGLVARCRNACLPPVKVSSSAPAKPDVPDDAWEIK